MTPGGGYVTIDETHVGGGKCDDAISIEDVTRVDRQNDAQYWYDDAETAQVDELHR